MPAKDVGFSYGFCDSTLKIVDVCSRKALWYVSRGCVDFYAQRHSMCYRFVAFNLRYMMLAILVYVGKWLPPVWQQAITWTHSNLSTFGPLRTILSKIGIKSANFHSRKCICVEISDHIHITIYRIIFSEYMSNRAKNVCKCYMICWVSTILICLWTNWDVGPGLLYLQQMRLWLG